MAYNIKKNSIKNNKVLNTPDEDEVLTRLALDFFKKINKFDTEDIATVVNISTPITQGIKTMDVVCDLCKSSKVPCKCVEGLIELDNNIQEIKDLQLGIVSEEILESHNTDDYHLTEAMNKDKNVEESDDNDESSVESLQLTEIRPEKESDNTLDSQEDKIYLDIPSDNEILSEEGYDPINTYKDENKNKNKNKINKTQKITFSHNKDLLENLPGQSLGNDSEYYQSKENFGLIFDKNLIGANTHKILQNMSGKPHEIPYTDNPTLAFLSAQIITSYALSEKRFNMIEEQNTNSLSLFTALNDNIVSMLQHMVIMDGKINSLTNQVNDLDGRIKSLLSSLCIYEERRSEGIRKTGVDVISKTNFKDTDNEDLIDYLIKITPLSAKNTFNTNHAKILAKMFGDTDDNLLNWLESINLRVESSQKTIHDIKTNPLKEKYKKTLVSIILAYTKHLIKERKGNEHDDKKESTGGLKHLPEQNAIKQTTSAYQDMMKLWDSHNPLNDKNQKTDNVVEKYNDKTRRLNDNENLYDDVDENDW